MAVTRRESDCPVHSRGRARITALPSVPVRDNRITEKGSGLPQLATGLQSNLIELGAVMTAPLAGPGAVA